LSALRGRELVRRILTFSRKTTREQKTVDLAPVIRESLNLLRATLPSTINVNLSMTAEDYVTRVDVDGIHQILLNICTNAAHAMPDGGELSVSVTEAKFITPLTLLKHLKDPRRPPRMVR
jgi:signal transduction histidine kinase